jgi:hypothetical protein
MKINTFFAFIILQYHTGYSQIVFNGVDQSKQSKLIQVRNFFVSRPAIDFGIDSGTINPELLTTYDTAINIFFNYEQMIKEFNDYKGGSKFEYLKYYQYRALNGIHKMIDYVREDSILVMKKKDYMVKYEPLNSLDSSQLDNFFLGGFIINGEYYPMIEMKFDKSDKLIFIMPMIYFDTDKAEVIKNFLKRQKN